MNAGSDPAVKEYENKDNKVYASDKKNAAKAKGKRSDFCLDEIVFKSIDL